MNKGYTHDIRNGTAVIVESKHMFDRWIVNYDRQCKFTFKTAKSEGLFAVIHNMYFRRNGSDCLDYVRVSCGFGGELRNFLWRSQTVGKILR